ncbi:MAG: KTSC domain-containing protein [Methanothrix sp.]|nr:KTSC domain-containing protein [Methanothrix sp.]
MGWIATPESSNIAGFDYVENTSILIVEFKNGARYNYYDVPAAVFNSLKTAPSKGKYLAQSVKGVYRYARV